MYKMLIIFSKKRCQFRKCVQCFRISVTYSNCKTSFPGSFEKIQQIFNNYFFIYYTINKKSSFRSRNVIFYGNSQSGGSVGCLAIDKIYIFHRSYFHYILHFMWQGGK